MLSDFASFLISLFAIWVATRPPSTKFSFGWHRAGTLLVLGSVAIILSRVMINIAIIVKAILLQISAIIINCQPWQFVLIL